MSDDLDDLLGSLGTAPIAPLAEADLVRRRGAQRRGRLRIGTAVAGLVLVAGAGGIALAAAGGNDLAVVQPGVTADPAPSATAEPSPSTGGTTDLASLRSALLTADDAAQANGNGDWSVTSPVDQPALLSICPTGDGYGGEGLETTLRYGSTSVLSRVVRTGDASGYRDGLAQEIATCPHGPTGDASVAWSTIPTSDPEVVVLHESAVSWVVVADGELVSLTRLPTKLDGDAQTWGHVALARLRQAASGSPHPAGFPQDVDTGRNDAWAVYLTTTASADDSRLAAAVDQAQRVGYFPRSGELTCDIGAPEGLHLAAGKTYYTVPLYFGSAQDAQQFVDSFEPGVTGTVHVTLVCND